ncbi:MAG: AMP-binding protein, partial [Panacagrimonas sp.]
MNYDLAAWGAELTPDRPAVWFNGRWYSYRDLNERATRLANRLAASGIRYGARVGLLAGNHLA